MTILQKLGQRERALDVDHRATAFSQFAFCLALARGDGLQAKQLFAKRHPLSIHKDKITRAAVAPGSTASGNWAQPLSDMSTFADAFVEFLRPLSIVEQIRPAFRTVPFNVRFSRTTAGTAIGWTGQGAPTQASALAIEAMTFQAFKIAGVCVFTQELETLSNPAVDALVRSDLASVVAKFTDESFFGLDMPGVTGVSPASITTGATNIPSTGTTAAQVETDIGNLLVAVTTNRQALFIVMRRSTALAMSRLKDATTGQRTFPNLSIAGGNIYGADVIVSDNLPPDESSPSGNIIVAIDADEILYGDGGIELSASGRATLQMQSAPDNPPTASSVMVSLWQQNLVGVMATRFLNWQRRRNGSVAYISNCNY